MDDKMLEQRLKQLKDSYERVPSVSSPETIMEHIQMHEKKKTPKTWFHFPYVASFIGVFILGSILGMQFFQDLRSEEPSSLSAPSERNEEEASLADMEEAALPFSEPSMKKEAAYEVAEEKYSEAVRDLSLVYDRLANDLENKLFLQEVESYSFVQEAKQKLDHFETTVKTEANNEQDFLRIWDEHRQFIIEKMMTLELEYTELEREAHFLNTRGERSLEARLEAFIQKQNELLPAYQERWWKVQEEVSFNGNLETLIEQLNDQKAPASDNVQEFKTMVMASGYEFYDEGEGMIGLHIDFLKMKKTFESYLSPAFVQRLEMLAQKQVAVDGALSIPFEQLGTYIVELEKVILEDPSSFGATLLYEQYKQALRYYLVGTDNTSLFHSDGLLKEQVKEDYEQFLQKHGDTKASMAVKERYEQLQSAKFQNNSEASLLFPKLLEEQTAGP